MRVPFHKLVEFGVDFMSRLGVPGETARYAAQIVVETEAMGRTTHGIVQYRAIYESLKSGIVPDAEPEIVRQRPASVLMDGTRCLGVASAKRAIELGRTIARNVGISFVAVRNSYWIGAIGTYLLPLAQDGFVAYVWAQTNTCKDCAPFGGIDPRFSTNPVAFACCGGELPVIADFSTATMSMRKALVMVERGEKSALPRFLTSEGIPTTDPSVVKEGGTLMFMGCECDGYKGYALSFFNEILAALSGGGANNPSSKPHQAFSFLILDPDAFAGRDFFCNEMKRFIAYVKSSRPRNGVKKIWIPGEQAFSRLADSKKHGVLLDNKAVQLLKQIAEETGISFPIS